jgi:hypothetical protein
MKKLDKKFSRIERLTEQQLLISILSHQRTIETLFGVLGRKICGLSQQNSFMLKELVKQRSCLGLKSLSNSAGSISEKKSRVVPPVFVAECSAAAAELNSVKKVCGVE